MIRRFLLQRRLGEDWGVIINRCLWQGWIGSWPHSFRDGADVRRSLDQTDECDFAGSAGTIDSSHVTRNAAGLVHGRDILHQGGGRLAEEVSTHCRQLSDAGRLLLRGGRGTVTRPGYLQQELGVLYHPLYGGDDRKASRFARFPGLSLRERHGLDHLLPGIVLHGHVASMTILAQKVPRTPPSAPVSTVPSPSGAEGPAAVVAPPIGMLATPRMHILHVVGDGIGETLIAQLAHGRATTCGGRCLLIFILLPLLNLLLLLLVSILKLLGQIWNLRGREGKGGILRYLD